MWSEGSLASEAVQKFAEEGDTSGFDFEAQAYGGVRDMFTAAPIRAGLGKTATNFITDGSHTKVRLYNIFDICCSAVLLLQS
jgi:hypothetical protein